ncbi:MAG: inositol monophosphatase family protein, partial [Thermoanaerobaculia bacterium]|nr:inositol monophosphatase family protein [Thermoanaerobaculia bacterium]
RLRESILSRWPDHSILGEEQGATEGKSAYSWTIDPIDGTMSLRNGVPLFGTILALHADSEPLLGIIQLPMLDRCYWAAKGLGTRCNGRIVSIDGASDIEGEIIALGDRAQFARAGREAVFDELMRRHSWARTYTDCFGHAMVIEGSVGAMADFDLNAWDVGATKILIEEAGGRFERLPGDPEKWNVVFGKPAIVDWIIGLIDPLMEGRG